MRQPAVWSQDVSGDEFLHRPHRKYFLKMDQELEADFRRKAFHEAGHVLVATHFGVPPEDIDAYVQARLGAGHSVYYEAVTVFCRAEKPPYDFSVMGWAGVLAEELAQKDLETWQGALLSLWQFYDHDLEGRASRKEGNGSPSFQDIRWIIGYADSARTFNDAAEIIEQGYEFLLRVVGRLMLEANLSFGANVVNVVTLPSCLSLRTARIRWPSWMPPAG